MFNHLYKNILVRATADASGLSLRNLNEGGFALKVILQCFPSPSEAIATEGIFLNIIAKKQYQRATADKSAQLSCPPAIAKEGSPSKIST